MCNQVLARLAAAEAQKQEARMLELEAKPAPSNDGNTVEWSQTSVWTGYRRASITALGIIENIVRPKPSVISPLSPSSPPEGDTANLIPEPGELNPLMKVQLHTHSIPGLSGTPHLEDAQSRAGSLAEQGMQSGVPMVTPLLPGNDSDWLLDMHEAILEVQQRSSDGVDGMQNAAVGKLKAVLSQRFDVGDNIW